MAKNYDTTGNSWNNPLQHNDSSGRYSNTNGLLGFLDSTLNFIGFGDANASSNLFAELTGYNSQQREFEQQEYLMDKQNEYNKPINQMQRMKDAGINANTAAAGIAQGGNESAQAPQVSSNTQGAAAGLSAASSMLGSIGQVAQVASQVRKNNAEASNQESQAFRSNKLLPLDYQLSLENIGLTRGQSMALAIENYYRPQQQFLQTAQMYLQLPFMCKQMNLLDAEYLSEMKSIDLMEQQIQESKGRVDLMTWDKLVMESQARRNNAEANLISRKFQLLRDFGWDPTTGVGGLLAGNFVMRQSENWEEASGMFEDLLSTMWLESFQKSEGAAFGSLEVEKGLIKAREEAEGRLQNNQARLEIGKQGLQSALNVGETYMNKPKVRAFGFGVD